MMKIQHIKTGKIRELRRRDWENNDEYINMRSSWVIIDSGDPVMLWSVFPDGSRMKSGKVDRDDAESRIEVFPTKYYYREIEPSLLRKISNALSAPKQPKSYTPKGPKAASLEPEVTTDSRPQRVHQQELVPDNEPRYNHWDKAKYIAGILGGIAAILGFLEKCTGIG